MPSGSADRPGLLARTIGMRMKARMAKQQLTLDDVAPQVGVSSSQLSKLLLGRRGMTIEQLDRLAWRLGTTIEAVIVESSNATSDRRSKWPEATEKAVAAGSKDHLWSVDEVDSNLVRKVRHLIDMSRPRKSATETYDELAAACRPAGVLLASSQWDDVVCGRINPRVSWPDLLTPLADFFGVPDGYLRLDNPSEDDRVEADLRFESAMHDLGVQRVAARSSGTPSAEEVLDITESVSRAVDALRAMRDPARVDPDAV